MAVFVLVVAETAGQAGRFGCVRPEQDSSTASVRKVQAVRLLLPHNADLTGEIGAFPPPGR